MADTTAYVLASRATYRMNGVRAELARLRQEQQAEVTAAVNYTNDRYSTEGLREVRQQKVADVRAKYAEQFRQLKVQVSADHELLVDNLEKQRPVIGSDAGSVMRAQAKWDQVRMRIEAGMPLKRILETADTETALAIREWAPSWMEARFYQAGGASGISGQASTPFDPGPLLRSVDDRLADADLAFRETVSQARQAEVIKAGAAPMLEHDHAGAAGAPTGSALGAVITSRVNEAEAAKRYVDPTPDATPSAAPPGVE